jgi:hypothetical protein
VRAARVRDEPKWRVSVGDEDEGVTHSSNSPANSPVQPLSDGRECG